MFRVVVAGRYLVCRFYVDSTDPFANKQECPQRMMSATRWPIGARHDRAAPHVGKREAAARLGDR